MHHADSGALYRAATLARTTVPGAPPEWTAESVLREARRVTQTRRGTTFEIRLDGMPVDAELHTPEVTALVSGVAKLTPVRAWANAKMRECAADGPIVVDGRDMGTAVFPDARLKVFLVAEAGVRARRRLLQRLRREPSVAEVTAETVALTQRDAKDAAQTQQADDAVLVDTTDLTQDEQVDLIVALARERLAGT